MKTIQCKQCKQCKKEFINKFYSKTRKFCSKSCAAFFNKKHNNHNLSILLNDTNKSFYWIGFLLADGNVKDNNSISLEISKKDSSHLNNFANYISYKNKIRTRRAVNSISECNIPIVQQIINKFDFKPNKTYNPPNIKTYKNFAKENLFSLIIGFIDGDGNMRQIKSRKNAFQLTLENHSSWINFYKLIEKFLYEYLNYIPQKESHIRYNIRNYICLTFCNKIFLNKINLKRKELKLPVLERKWNILNDIDLN